MSKATAHPLSGNETNALFEARDAALVVADAQRVKKIEDEILLGNMGFAEAVAKSFTKKFSNCVDYESDRCQDAIVELARAISDYDRMRGASFKNYARTRIRAAIINEQGKSLNPLSISGSAVCHANFIRKTRAQLFCETGEEPSDEDVARRSGRTLAMVRNSRTPLCRSFDAPYSFGGESRRYLDVIADDDAESPRLAVEKRELLSSLREHICEMDAQANAVVSLYLKQRTFQSIGDTLGISKSRANQIFQKIVQLLRRRLLREGYEPAS